MALRLLLELVPFLFQLFLLSPHLLLKLLEMK